MQKTKQAFTLVELIVVITILAILGTISFLAFAGYSKDARDSTRISDVNAIEKAMELYVLKVGEYPEPTDGEQITYTGSEVWTQGIIGDSVMTNLGRVTPKPVDPLTGSEYTYSRLNTKKEYEIGFILEGGGVSYNSLVPETNAADNLTAYVKGTYNGVVAKVSTGSSTYVLAVPTIIATEVGDLLEIIRDKKLVLSGNSNIPSSYIGVDGYTASGGFDYNSANSGSILVYEGPISELKTDSNLKILADNLKIAYDNTEISSKGVYAELVAIDTDDINKIKSLVGNIVNNELGGKIDLVNNDDVQLINKVNCELANWKWVDSSNDVYIGTNQGDGFCISPRYGDWQTNGIDLYDGAGAISWNGWGNDSTLDYFYGWDASSVDDSGNPISNKGQTRVLDSEDSYECKTLLTALEDFVETDNIVGRMKWLSTIGNSYSEARDIDWITGLVPQFTGPNPHSIPALFIADCIDGVKDLGQTMSYTHKNNILTNMG